jgi:SAM-dependent methyltransferase
MIAVHDGPVVSTVGEFDVIECVACGFKHAVPLPDPAELERIYREEYFSETKPGYFDRHRADAEWWSLVHGDRYETFEELLPATRRRLLDVGSGPGLFLEEGARRGWTSIGVEPSRQAAAYARSNGATILEGLFLPETVADLEPVDVVHLSEVIEHVADPAAVLSLAHDVLEPDGLLCISTPNDFSPFQLAAREVEELPEWWVVPPHHLNYFDFDSLAGLMRRCGFEACIREATFPIDLFLLMGDRYVGDDELGRACHAKRKRLELGLERAGFGDLRRRLYRSLADLGIGREVVLVARRLDSKG